MKALSTGRKRLAVGAVCLALTGAASLLILLPHRAAASAGEQDLAERQQLFHQAGEAYKAGTLDQAADLYEQIIDSGFAAPELYYNLGNTYFRSDNIPSAILNYRRAWHMTPRDADIQANLQFAVNTAGALRTQPGIYLRLAQKRTPSEWARLATIGYWILLLCMAAYLIMPRARMISTRLAALALALLLVSLAGLAQWHALQKRPEAVVLDKDQKALFAPIPDSTVHFDVPAGSIVRILETQDGWSRIDVDDKEGWIQRDAYSILYPWQDRS